MTIVLLIALIYAAGLVLLVGLCRCAAAGDRHLRRPASGAHEFPLAG